MSEEIIIYEFQGLVIVFEQNGQLLIFENVFIEQHSRIIKTSILRRAIYYMVLKSFQEGFL